MFLLADVRKPILGTDFFRAHDLLIDISNCRLFRSQDSFPAAVEVRARPAHFEGGLCGLRRLMPSSPVLPINPSPSARRQPSSSLSSCQRSVLELFKKFPTVTSSPVFDSSTPKHGIYHTVPTSGPPVFARARRLFSATNWMLLARSLKRWPKWGLSVHLIHLGPPPCMWFPRLMVDGGLAGITGS